MKTLTLTLLCASLIGCVTVPVTQKFPTAPTELLVPPPELKEIPANATATDVMNTVIDNYETYNNVADKMRLWQKWYQDQKQNFEKIQ